jgi:hypothetical protein
MRIEVTDGKIEGFCNVDGFIGEMSVITFLQNRDRWTTGSSMCLPSDINAAMQVADCVNAAIEELKWAVEWGIKQSK